MRIVLKVLRYVVVAVSVVGYLMAFVMAGNLLTPWWYVAVGAGFVAVVSGLAYWRVWAGITRRSSFALNYAAHVVVVAGLLMCLVFGLNLVESPTHKPSRHKYAIESLYRSEHHQTRRIRKNVYRADGPVYYRYNVVFRVSADRTMKITVPYKRYRLLQRRDSVTVTHRPGLLGMTYVAP